MAQKQETNGTWTYYGKYTNTKGERVNYKKRGFKTKKDAKEAERLFKLSLDPTVRKENMTFKQLSNDFLENHFSTQAKKSSYQSNLYVFKRICEVFGDTPISKMTSSALQNYIDECDKQYSKQYVTKIYYCINKAFRYAIMKDYIASNPLNKVYRDTRKDELRTEFNFWEPEHFEAFIEAVDDVMYHALFSFLYYTGARKGEMLALTWKDINFSSNTVRIEKTVTYKTQGNVWLITSPKTKGSFRTITMSDALVGAMKAWREKQSAYYGFNDDCFVFSMDRPLPQETLRRNFKNYLKLANQLSDIEIPDIRIHDFRHSHASFLINNMSDRFTDFDVAKRLGDTVATLHDTYAHWFKQADKNIVDMMNQQNTTKPQETDMKPQQNINKYEELKQLKELLDLEIITVEEFQIKKKELLGL